MGWYQQVPFVAEDTYSIIVEIEFLGVFFLKGQFDGSYFLFLVNDDWVVVLDAGVFFDELICPVCWAGFLEEEDVYVVFEKVLKNFLEFDLDFTLGFVLFLLQKL